MLFFFFAEQQEKEQNWADFLGEAGHTVASDDDNVYLGMAVTRISATCLRLSQERYIKEVMLKFGFNLPDDGLVGQQLFAGEATRLAYGTDEAVEGRDAFLEKRDQDYSRFPWHF